MIGPISACGVWNCPACHPDAELPVSDPKTWDDYAGRWDLAKQRWGTSPAQPGPAPDYSLDYKSGWFDGFHAAKAAP